MTKNQALVAVGIIATVVIALFGMLFAMNGTLGSVVAKLDATASRVDRIAAALPDLKVKLANEELSKPLSLVVIVTNPIQDVSGKPKSKIAVLDFPNKKGKTYEIELKTADPKIEVAKWASSAAPYYYDGSFNDYSKFSSDIGKPLKPPPYVDMDASAVLTRFDSAVAALLYSKPIDAFISTYATIIDVKSYSLTTAPSSFADLLSLLKESGSTYFLP